MAKTQAERTAKSEAKKKAAGEEELRHKVRPGIKAMMADLMEWHRIELQSEAIQNMVINLHALGPQGSASICATPRHEIRISENVARDFERESLKELRRDPGDEP